MRSALAEQMVGLLNLKATLEPMPGATRTVWAVGGQVLRLGATVRMEKELAASAAASAVVRVPRVLDRVDVGDQTGLLLERIQGGSAGDLAGCTEGEARARGHACGALQVSLATVEAPALVPPLLWADAEEVPSVLLHLDLHPLNILVDTLGDLVVIDWANAAAGPAVLDRARTAAILTFDPTVRRLTDDPRCAALIQGWSDECGWDTLPDASWIWALEFLLHDLEQRWSPAELEPAREALAARLR
jgi:hypothetical protein